MHDDQQPEPGGGHQDERPRQLLDLAREGNQEAAADLFKEYQIDVGRAHP